MNCRLLLIVLLGASVTATALAAPVAITNPGFEAPYLGGNLPPQYNGDVPPTAFPVGSAPSGWQSYGAVGGNAFIGVLNPGVMAVEPLATYFPAGAFEGDNVALTFYDGHLGGAEFSISQTLSATLTANTFYTLSVAVGNIASGRAAVQPYAGFGFFDLRGFPGYRVELLAGGNVIASDNDSLSPGEGLFETSIVELIVGDSHSQLGQPLGIRLVNRNQSDVIDPVVDLEVDFDAVALDATPFDPTGVTGDYNNNGSVDAADYVLWRRRENTNRLLPNDPMGGTVDGDQLAQWRAHFGNNTGAGAGLALSSGDNIPEPGAAWLLSASSLLSLQRSRRRA